MSLDIWDDRIITSAKRLAWPRGDASGLALFAILFVLALVPVLVTPIPAMVDYINHLARMYVIAANGTPDASPFYDLKWTLTPNLAMDLVVPRLAKGISRLGFGGLGFSGLGVERATRLFLLVSQILIVTGAVAIEAVVKRRFQISGTIALLLLSCAPFAWGFLNFEFALGLALWGIAGWLLLRDKPWPVRFAAHTLVVTLLFVSHLFALGLYGFALGMHEAWSAWRARASVREMLVTGLTLATPAVLLLGLMAVSGGSVGQAGNSWHLGMKPFWLFALLNGYSVVLSTAGMLALIGLVHALATRRALSFEASGAWMASGLAALYIAVPATLFDTALVDVRIMAAALLIVPAFVTVSFPSDRLRIAATGLIAGLILANIGLTAFVWTSYQADYRGMIASFAHLRPGARILVGHSGADERDPPFQDLTDYPIYHAPTLAVAYAGAFVPTLFTTKGKQPIEVRADLAHLAYSCGGPVPTAFLKAVADGHPPSDAPEFVRSWSRDFDYLYVVGAKEANPMPERLEVMEDHPRFTLYRIRKQAVGGSVQGDLTSPRRVAD